MNTSLSKSGDFGSKLPAMPSQETWKAGMVYEAGWTVSAHHGGGYAYRIAPADGPLTEEAFRKTPLDFVGNSILRWGGNKSSQLEFDSKGKGWQLQRRNQRRNRPCRLDVAQISADDVAVVPGGPVV